MHARFLEFFSLAACWHNIKERFSSIIIGDLQYQCPAVPLARSIGQKPDRPMEMFWKALELVFGDGGTSSIIIPLWFLRCHKWRSKTATPVCRTRGMRPEGRTPLVH
jgi:hypothetical protein